MGILDLFRRKPKTEEEKPTEEPSLLRELCGEDKALYEDLSWSMYLDPTGKGTYEEAVEKAQKAEREGNRLDARIGYQHAGSLALYEKNAAGVKASFDKVAELSERKFQRIREVPEKAIKIVNQYYEKELKKL